MENTTTKSNRRKHFHRFILSYLFFFILFVAITALLPALLVSAFQFVLDNDLVLVGDNQITQGTEIVYYLKHPIVTLSIIFSDGDFKKIYLVSQGLVTGIALYQAIIVWIKVKPHKVESGSDYGSHGDARWAEEKEITRDKKNFMSDIDNELDFGSLIGKAPYSNEYIIRKFDSTMNNHTMVVAGSGKGKTQAYALNQIFLTKFQTLIMSDAKGELYKKTSKQKKKDGFKILFLDFIKFSGNQWNPIANMVFDEIDNFSNTLVSAADDDSNNIWGGHAINLISACIAFVLENLEVSEQHMGFVRQLMTLGEERLKEQFDQLDEGSIAQNYFKDVAGISGEAWNGVVATATNATRFWKQKRIQRFTERSDFKFSDLGSEKIALYIRVHPTDKTYSSLVNTFFSQMINHLIEDVDEFGGKYPVNIKMVLDEFPGLGKIEAYPGALAFIRSLGVGIETIVQDLAQLEKVYGKEDMRSIISNCDNFIFLGTNEDDQTAPRISKKLGNETIFLRNDQGKATSFDHSNDNQQYTPTKRPLMSESQILKMEKDTGVYFPSAKFPIKFKKIYAYELFEAMPEAPLNWHIDAENLNADEPSRKEPGVNNTTSTDDLNQSIFESSFLQQEPSTDKVEELEDITEEKEEKQLSANDFTLPY